MSLLSLIADAVPAVQPAANAANNAAAQSAPSKGGGFLDMLPILVIFAVMIFFMMRSQKKQKEKRQEMINRIAKGAKVVLGGGIFGTVSEVKETSCMVEIASGVLIEVEKAGVAALVESQNPAAKA